jgi:hypothetical protein
MSLQMMDAGFLFGPLLGAQILAISSFKVLYIASALLTFLIAIGTYLIPRVRMSQSE